MTKYKTWHHKHFYSVPTESPKFYFFDFEICLRYKLDLADSSDTRIYKVIIKKLQNGTNFWFPFPFL